MYDVPWLISTWKLIREDRVSDYRMTMALLPLARTSMDKKSGEALNKYQKKIANMLTESIPWQLDDREPRQRAKARGAQDGKMTVRLDSGESADFPLYKNARISREK